MSCRHHWHRRWQRSRPPALPVTRRPTPAHRRSRNRACRRSASDFSFLAEIALEHGGIAYDGLRRAFGDLLAMVQDDDMLGERHDRAHDVLDQQNGDLMLAVHPAEEF